MTDRRLKFRTAEFYDFPQLIKMWKDCFADSQNVIDNIFANLQKPENIFVLANEDEPAAMLSTIDFSLTSPSGSHKAAYIYGVATSPAEQGKGLGSTLLNDVGELLAHGGYACSVLVPASDSLFNYYGQRGYEKAFNMNKASFTAEEISAGEIFPLEKIDSAKLAFLRSSRLGDSRMFACWDMGYLEYVVNESELYGGGTYTVTIGGKQVCAVCHKSGDTVYIKELGATHDTLEPALRSLHAHFGANEYKLYLREDFKIPYTNNLLPFAMIKWYDNEVKSAVAASGGAPAYITHVLD